MGRLREAPLADYMPDMSMEYRLVIRESWCRKVAGGVKLLYLSIAHCTRIWITSDSCRNTLPTRNPSDPVGEALSGELPDLFGEKSASTAVSSLEPLHVVHARDGLVRPWVFVLGTQRRRQQQA